MALVIQNDELAAAAAAADATGEPMARWALLVELGMVAGAEQLPIPRTINTPHDHDLVVQFGDPEGARAWLDWWGHPVETDRPGTHPVLMTAAPFGWRGWNVYVQWWTR